MRRSKKILGICLFISAIGSFLYLLYCNQLEHSGNVNHYGEVYLLNMRVMIFVAKPILVFSLSVLIISIVRKYVEIDLSVHLRNNLLRTFCIILAVYSVCVIALLLQPFYISQSLQIAFLYFANSLIPFCILGIGVALVL